MLILTLCTTGHKDSAGRPLTGVTCVGVRGCVDYDCTPSLCHEKDLAFLDTMGALLSHVAGAGYAKFLAVQRLVLPRDSWKDAFRIQEQRDLNLRTNYGNYARGMANLAFGLNRGSDPKVAVYETPVPRRDGRISARRELSWPMAPPLTAGRWCKSASWSRAGTNWNWMGALSGSGRPPSWSGAPKLGSRGIRRGGCA